MKHTVRLTALAEISGRTRDTIRALQNRQITPWDDTEFADQPGYRNYTGLHALTLVLAEMLSGMNIHADRAAELVRDNLHVVNKFLDGIDKGKGVQPLFIANIVTLEFDSWVGRNWKETELLSTGTFEEIANTFAAKGELAGQEKQTRGGRSIERSTGVINVAVVALAEAYLILKERAEAAGFVLDGRKIYKIKDAETEEGDSL
ncbi:hypothetical protein ACFQ3C_01520 [Seohaeicola saemankumensis]|uniref:HTH merR-type domain-containing protein n=1 Tax=Seohaeicola saemankumensis TaxID=481181 RepID=A0ABW3T8Y0_9RHOB